MDPSSPLAARTLSMGMHVSDRGPSPPLEGGREPLPMGSYRHGPPPHHDYAGGGGSYHYPPSYPYPSPHHVAYNGGYAPPPPSNGFVPHHGHPGYGAYSPTARHMYGGFGGYEGTSTGSAYHMPRGRESRQKDPASPYGSGRPSKGRAPQPQPLSRSHRTTQQRQQSPVRGAENVPSSSPDDSTSGQATRDSPEKSTLLADELETERLRAAALTEISPSQVEPIKTSFHLFLLDVRQQIRKDAEAEIRQANSREGNDELNKYLVNTNMNSRIMKAWEDLSADDRQKYVKLEEADRRRFMEEEEIASRHCATLTARSKSPKTPERRLSVDRSEASEITPSSGPSSHSTLPRNADADSSQDEKKIDGENDEICQDNEVGEKRPSPPKRGGSPPKRNRVDAKEEASQH